MLDVSDLRATIIPKSDQLNADQLVGGPMTITVTHVTVGSTEEQPVSVHYENEAGRPFKPCKTMRKVLVFAWGADGRQWVGRSMTLYNDPAVKFGGEEVGGIRISHISDIERDLQVSLTATKGKKKLYTIKRLEPARKPHRPERTERHAKLIGELEALASESGFGTFKDAWAAMPKEDRAAIGTAERDRIGAIGHKHDEDAAPEGFDADEREAA